MTSPLVLISLTIKSLYLCLIVPLKPSISLYKYSVIPTSVSLKLSSFSATTLTFYSNFLQKPHLIELFFSNHFRHLQYSIWFCIILSQRFDLMLFSKFLNLFFILWKFHAMDKKDTKKKAILRRVLHLYRTQTKYSLIF